MKLKYTDNIGNEQTLDVKSVDLLHKNETALVVDTEEKAYEIDIKRVLQIKN